LEEQSRQRRTEKTSADAPMVRALFVFRAAELTSGAAAAAEKPGPVVTAPGGQQASPPPAVRK
jgi:hypothetical protein